MRQYVVVEFKPGGSLYTYLNDEPFEIKPGDTVEVETKFGTRQLPVISINPSSSFNGDLKRCRKI